MWKPAEKAVCPLRPCMGRGCALGGGPLWPRGLEEEVGSNEMGLKGHTGEFLLSPAGAGRLLKSLKLGNERNRFVFS